MIIYWTIFVILLEVYSLGIALVAKHDGQTNYWVNLIPFVALFYVDHHLEDSFKILTIPVKKFLKTVIFQTIVIIISFVLIKIAKGFYENPKNVEYFVQIMVLPIVVGSLIILIGLANSATQILFEREVSFKKINLVCLTIFAIPFLTKMLNKKGKQNETK